MILPSLLPNGYGCVDPWTLRTVRTCAIATPDRDSNPDLPLATRTPRCVATKPRLGPPKQPASKSEVAPGVRIAAMVSGATYH